MGSPSFETQASPAPQDEGEAFETGSYRRIEAVSP